MQGLGGHFVECRHFMQQYLRMFRLVRVLLTVSFHLHYTLIEQLL